MDPIAVGNIAGRVVEGLGSIAAAGLVVGMGALGGLVVEGIGYSAVEVDAGSAGGTGTGQEEERWVGEDHLTRSHGGRTEDVVVVEVVVDDSDTRLGWRWVLDCRMDSGSMSDSGAEAEVPEL